MIHSMIDSMLHAIACQGLLEQCSISHTRAQITHHRKVAQYINLYNGIKPHVNTYKFIHCYKDLQGVNLYGVKLYTVYMATPHKTHVKPHVFYTM